MCLKVELTDKPKIAKSNIRCYKLVRKTSSGLKTIYRGASVVIGKKYGSEFSFEFDMNKKSVEKGLHSITNLKDAKALVVAEAKIGWSGLVIARCTIPKGSQYFTGLFGSRDQFRSYASDCVVYNEII